MCYPRPCYHLPSFSCQPFELLSSSSQDPIFLAFLIRLFSPPWRITARARYGNIVRVCLPLRPSHLLSCGSRGLLFSTLHIQWRSSLRMLQGKLGCASFKLNSVQLSAAGQGRSNPKGQTSVQNPCAFRTTSASFIFMFRRFGFTYKEKW